MPRLGVTRVQAPAPDPTTPAAPSGASALAGRDAPGATLSVADAPVVEGEPLAGGAPVGGSAAGGDDAGAGACSEAVAGDEANVLSQLPEACHARYHALLQLSAAEIKRMLHQLELQTGGTQQELVARLVRRLEKLPPADGDEKPAAKRRRLAAEAAELEASAAVCSVDADGTSGAAHGSERPEGPHEPPLQDRLGPAANELPAADQGGAPPVVRPSFLPHKKRKKDKDHHRDKDHHKDKEARREAKRRAAQDALLQEKPLNEPDAEMDGPAAEVASGAAGASEAPAQDTSGATGASEAPAQDEAVHAPSRALELLREAQEKRRLEREAMAPEALEPMPGEGEPGAYVVTLSTEEVELFSFAAGRWRRLLSEVAGVHLEVSGDALTTQGRLPAGGADVVPKVDGQGVLARPKEAGEQAGVRGESTEAGGDPGTGASSTQLALEGLPPRLLILSSHQPDRDEWAGLFVLQSDGANELPLWKRVGRDFWLYSSSDGVWTIGGEDQEDLGFDCKTGFARAATSHRGLLPHKSAERWQRCESLESQEWRDDPNLVVTALARGVLVKVGGLKRRPLRRANGRFGIVISEDPPATADPSAPVRDDARSVAGSCAVRLADGTEEAIPAECLIPRRMEQSEVWIRPREPGIGAFQEHAEWAEMLMRALVASAKGKSVAEGDVPGPHAGVGLSHVAMPSTHVADIVVKRLRQLMEDHDVVAILLRCSTPEPPQLPCGDIRTSAALGNPAAPGQPATPEEIQQERAAQKTPPLLGPTGTATPIAPEDPPPAAGTPSGGPQAGAAGTPPPQEAATGTPPLMEATSDAHQAAAGTPPLLQEGAEPKVPAAGPPPPQAPAAGTPPLPEQEAAPTSSANGASTNVAADCAPGIPRAPPSSTPGTSLGVDEACPSQSSKARPRLGTRVLLYGDRDPRRRCQLKVASLVQQAARTRSAASNAPVPPSDEEGEDPDQDTSRPGDRWGISRVLEDAAQNEQMAEAANKRRRACCDVIGAMVELSGDMTLFAGSRSQRAAVKALLALARTALPIGGGALAISSVPPELESFCLCVRVPDAAREAVVKMLSAAPEDRCTIFYWMPPLESPAKKPPRPAAEKPSLEPGTEVQAKYEGVWCNATIESYDESSETATVFWKYDESSSEVALKDLRAKLTKATKQRLGWLQGAWKLAILGPRRLRLEVALDALATAEKACPGLWTGDLEELSRELIREDDMDETGDATLGIHFVEPSGPSLDPVLEGVNWSSGGGRAALRRAATASGSILKAVANVVVAIGSTNERERGMDYLRLVVEDRRAAEEGAWFDVGTRDVQFQDPDGRKLQFQASDSDGVLFIVDGAPQLKELSGLRITGDKEKQSVSFVGTCPLEGSHWADSVRVCGVPPSKVVGLLYGRARTFARRLALADAEALKASADKCCMMEPADLRRVEANTGTIVLQEPVDSEAKWDAKAIVQVYICGQDAVKRQTARARVQELLETVEEWREPELSPEEREAAKLAEEEQLQAAKLGFRLGRFLLYQTIQIRKTKEPESEKVATLKAGRHVDVEEIICKRGSKNVLMRIRKPEGWISVAKKKSGSQAWAFLVAEEEEEEEEEDKPSGVDAATRANEELAGEAAEEPQAPEDAPGTYTILKRAAVQLTVQLGSEKFATLEAGQEVNVVEVVEREEDQRLRARIEEPAGWISLLNTETGFRWAEKAEEEDEAAAPLSPAATNPVDVIRSLKYWPKDNAAWKEVQHVVWKGHEELKEGWIRVWSRSKECEYYVRLSDGKSTFSRREAMEY